MHDWRRLAAVLTFMTLSVSSAAAQDRFEWDEVVAAGGILEIKGVNGSITALASPGPRATVVATKSSRRSDVSEVRIEVLESESGNVTICAVYPSEGGRPNTCEAGTEGRMNVRNNDVRVDFTVEVPPGVRFVARNVNGGIEAEGLDGDIEAYTVNGSIEVAGGGVVRARTVNGSIEASMGRSDWEDTIEFETVNGAITLELPGDTSASVEAETVNGAITTDFPLTVSGRFGPRRLSGTIEGTAPRNDRRLRLKTVNGGIRLRRSS